MRTRIPLAAAGCAVALAVGCGGGGSSDSSAASTAAAPAGGGTPASGTAAGAARTNRDWPLFGLTSARINATDAPSGVTAAGLAHLRRIRVSLPGTVDSSPIYLHAVRVAGRTRDVFVMTTTYGKTLALDARTGRIAWTYTPAGIGGWEGSYRITNASPAADPGRRAVYAASPDGLLHKLALSDGRQVRAGGWPVRLTRLPEREKLTSSLNISGGLVVMTTGGYIGDAPPYQGHVVAIDRVSGRIRGVFNSLCSDRHAIFEPSSCASSDSAIWARSGAVVEPRTRRLLVATGNAPWNGRTDWGDSVLLLSPDARRLLGHWTPANQAQLSAADVDLGSTGPVLLPGGLVLQSGKDAQLHLLSMRRILAAGARPVTGGELQTLSTPGGAGMFSAPAVYRRGGRTTVFATTEAGTAAYALRGGRLRRTWSNGTGGTSPVVAGGLLYVQSLDGGLNVYRPATGRRLATLPTGGAHWNSPVIAGGRIAVPEGDANDHSSTGTLSLFVPS
jgi:outer membrane protein assembly factor BamB